MGTNVELSAISNGGGRDGLSNLIVGAYNNSGTQGAEGSYIILGNNKGLLLPNANRSTGDIK